MSRYIVRPTSSGFEISEDYDGAGCCLGCLALIVILGLCVGVMVTPEILIEMYVNPLYYFLAIPIVIVHSILLYKKPFNNRNSIWILYLIESGIMGFILFAYNISDYFMNYYDRDFFTDIIMVISELTAFFVASLIYVLAWSVVAFIITKIIQKIKG